MIRKSFLGLIPARAGSKGIPKKNIIKVGGKPLLNWTIESALESKSIDGFVISSDDPAVIDIAIKDNIPYRKRPNELAKDDTLMEDVLQDLIKNYSEIDKFDFLILLQPTSPLRTSNHIDQAINELLSKNAQGLISVTSPLEVPQKMMTLDERGFLSGLIDNQMPFRSRQFLKETYKPNGAIYIVNIEAFKENKSFLQERTVPFYMDSESSLDIDTFDDLKLVEKVMNSFHLSK